MLGGLLGFFVALHVPDRGGRLDIGELAVEGPLEDDDAHDRGAAHEPLHRRQDRAQEDVEPQASTVVSIGALVGLNPEAAEVVAKILRVRSRGRSVMSILFRCRKLDIRYPIDGC